MVDESYFFYNVGSLLLSEEFHFMKQVAVLSGIVQKGGESNYNYDVGPMISRAKIWDSI